MLAYEPSHLASSTCIARRHKCLFALLKTAFAPLSQQVKLQNSFEHSPPFQGELQRRRQHTAIKVGIWLQPLGLYVLNQAPMRSITCPIISWQVKLVCNERECVCVCVRQREREREGEREGVCVCVRVCAFVCARARARIISMVPLWNAAEDASVWVRVAFKYIIYTNIVQVLICVIHQHKWYKGWMLHGGRGMHGFCRQLQTSALQTTFARPM